MKLIASDFDGTLCRGGPLTQIDRDAISKWRKDGNIFGLVSGRATIGLIWEQEAIKFEFDFLAGASGGHVVGADKEDLFAYTCDNEKIQRLAMFIRENGGLSCGVALPRNHVDLYNRNHPELDVELMKNIPYTTQMNTYFATEDEARIFVEKVNKEFVGEFTAHQNGGCVDIPPYGISKAVGIAKVAEIFGIAEKDIITIGDNYNDIPMIKAFNGAAVQNAKPEVKEAAKVVVNDFAELIEYFG